MNLYRNVLDSRCFRAISITTRIETRQFANLGMAGKALELYPLQLGLKLGLYGSCLTHDPFALELYPLQLGLKQNNFFHCPIFFLAL